MGSNDAPSAFTHRVSWPNEIAAQGDAGDQAKVWTWLNRRWGQTGRPLTLVVEESCHFASDVTTHATNDPVYAAVLAAVAEHGWEAGVQAIELIEAAGR